MEIKKQFLQRYDPQTTDFAGLPPYGAADFNAQLKRLMVGYGTTESGKQDAIANVQADIDNVKGIMTENIERVLERGERIDLLVDKTDRLGVGAHDFRVRSRGLKRQMWWKNMKLMVLLGVVVVFLIYLFVGFGCGLPGKETSLLVSASRSSKKTNLRHFSPRLEPLCGLRGRINRQLRASSWTTFDRSSIEHLLYDKRAEYYYLIHTSLSIYLFTSKATPQPPPTLPYSPPAPNTLHYPLSKTP